MSHMDEILEQIETKNEAAALIVRIASHFDIAGAAFVPDDVVEEVFEYVSNNDTFDELDDDDVDALTNECLALVDWDEVRDEMIVKGNEIIETVVAERMRELGV